MTARRYGSMATWRHGGIAALLLAAGPLAAQDVASALARAEDAYRRVETLTAAFRQTITNPMLGGPERSRGVLYVRKPDRFAMRFTEPAGDRIVADGTWLWLYAPSSVEGQVMRRPVPASGVNSPNLLGQFVERPLQRYEASYVRADTMSGQPVDVVRLVPRSDGMGFRNAEIAIARADGMLRRIAIVEESGQRRVLLFDDIRVDAPVAPRELEFDVPPGVKVVTP